MSLAFRLLLIFVCVEVFASQEPGANPYFDIHSVELFEISAEEEQMWVAQSLAGIPSQANLPAPIALPKAPATSLPQAALPPHTPTSRVGQFLQWGKWLHELIVDNKARLDWQESMVSVLPAEAPNAMALNGWRSAQSPAYRLVYKNGWQTEVVQIIFRLMFSHSGQWQDRGHYVANLGIIPTYLSVAWGYELNAESVVLPAANIGSGEDPVVEIITQLNWQIKTPMRYERRSHRFIVNGKGDIQSFTLPSSKK